VLDLNCTLSYLYLGSQSSYMAVVVCFNQLVMMMVMMMIKLMILS